MRPAVLGNRKNSFKDNVNLLRFWASTACKENLSGFVMGQLWVEGARLG